MDYVAVMATASGSDLTRELNSLLVIAAIAAATPLLVGLLRLPVAEVVLMLGWIELDAERSPKRYVRSDRPWQ